MPHPDDPEPLPTQPQPDLGQLGEDLVAQWVDRKGGQILDRRWHCRWGELDLIALNRSGHLVFIEVKTRRKSNWDANGALAITATKRTKLLKSAQLFLVEHPDLADRPCRIDIALVQSRLTDPSAPPSWSDHPIFSRTIAGYHLTLLDYLVNAVDLS